MNRNVSRTEQLGSLLAGGALLAFGARRSGVIGAVTALAGGSLCAHGMSRSSRLYSLLGIDAVGSEGEHPLNRTVHVRDSIVVNRPLDEVRSFWRDLSNLPKFMHDVESVEQLDERRSRWHARGPMGKEFHWDAELIESGVENVIKWRTIHSESNLEHLGTVRFEKTAGDRGTIVRIDFRWSPPGGVLGAAAAKLMPQDPKRRIHEDLRRFRQLIETGEIARATGESLENRKERTERNVQKRDEVEEAGEESFPASDAPALSTS